MIMKNNDVKVNDLDCVSVATTKLNNIINEKLVHTSEKSLIVKIGSASIEI